MFATLFASVVCAGQFFFYVRRTCLGDSDIFTYNIETSLLVSFLFSLHPSRPTRRHNARARVRVQSCVRRRQVCFAGYRRAFVFISKRTTSNGIVGVSTPLKKRKNYIHVIYPAHGDYKPVYGDHGVCKKKEQRFS